MTVEVSLSSMYQDSSRSLRPAARLGLLPRFVAALAVVGLLPLAGLAWQLVGLNRDAMTEQVLRTHTVAADAAASRLRSELQSRRAFLRRAAESLSLISTGQLGGHLGRILAEGEELGTVAVATVGHGEPWTARRDPAPDDLVARLAGLEPEMETFVRSGESLWLAARFGPVAMLFDTVDTTRALHPTELGADTSVHLLRDRQPVWASTDVALPGELAELAATRLSGSGRFSAAGTTYLGAFAPVGGSPWLVVSLQTTAAAERVAQSMRRRSAFAVVGAVGAVLLLSGLGFQTVIRPLRSVIAEAQSLLPPSGASGRDETPASGDEISRLAATFDSLARHVVQNESLEQVFLGRYQVLELIGEGAMGSVFMGWDPTLKRTVALKTLKVSGDRQAQGQADDLLAEAVTVASLDHPNIVQVHDVGRQVDVDFIAMEFVRGASLRDHLESGPLPLALTLHICLEVAEALAAAHAVDVLHNDIKPGNILLRDDGRTKITDFGISHAMNKIGAEQGLIYGTPGYLPPETISGLGRDERSDLFALGATAYECLVGSKPFLGQTIQAVLSKTLMSDPPPPGSMRQDVPPELDRLVLDLLHKDPSQRVPSARQAATRLAELAERFPWQPTSTTPVVGDAGDDAWSSAGSMIPTRLIESALSGPTPSLETRTLSPASPPLPLDETGDDA